jgi:hypothetical protein
MIWLNKIVTMAHTNSIPHATISDISNRLVLYLTVIFGIIWIIYAGWYGYLDMTPYTNNVVPIECKFEIIDNDNCRLSSKEYGYINIPCNTQFDRINPAGYTKCYYSNRYKNLSLRSSGSGPYIYIIIGMFVIMIPILTFYIILHSVTFFILKAFGY